MMRQSVPASRVIGSGNCGVGGAKVSAQAPRVIYVKAAEQAREEARFRKVEGAMLHVEDAARRLAEVADELKQEGAPAHLLAALETAAGAVRADHKRLMKSVYWPAPDDAQQELAAECDQQRLAS